MAEQKKHKEPEFKEKNDFNTTADIKFQAFGKTIEEVFINSALAR